MSIFVPFVPFMCVFNWLSGHLLGNRYSSRLLYILFVSVPICTFVVSHLGIKGDTLTMVIKNYVDFSYNF